MKNENSFSSNKAYQLVKIYESLFRATIVISTIGGSITFQVIIQQIPDSESVNQGHHFDRKTARSFLAIAWLLFVLALGIACLAAALLAFNKERLRIGLIKTRRDSYAAWGALASGIVLLLLLSAFLFSSMAVSSYAEGAGWIATAFTCVFSIIALTLWVRVCG